MAFLGINSGLLAERENGCIQSRYRIRPPTQQKYTTKRFRKMLIANDGDNF